MRLVGYPYVKSVAEWIYILVGVLNKLSGGFDDEGNRTEEDYEDLYEYLFQGQSSVLHG